MKLSKLLIIAIATLFFTACSTEEEYSLTRHELVFQASMGNNETRATSDGTWNVGDIVAVRVGTTVKKYVIETDGKVKGANAENTFYWEDLGVSSVEVTAWSFGKKYVESLSNGVTIESDQSEEQYYLNSDFLYAPTTTISKGEDDLSELSFYHQMARLNINIKCDESAVISSVVIGDKDEDNYYPLYLQATYTEPTAGTDDNYVATHGSFDIDYDSETNIIPYKKDDATSGYDVSYSAILLPAPYETFIVYITLADGSKFSYIGGIYNNNNNKVNPFDPGTVNTFNITIKNKELKVDGSFDAATGQTMDPVSVNDWIYQI